jgi:hypothetical protein
MASPFIQAFRLSATLIASFSLGVSAFAQTTPPQTPPAAQTPAAPPAQAAQTPGLVKVFLDCYRCDDEYMRQNVTFVEYVRDRAVADVHVLVTTQETGGGGLAWTLKFIGLGRFQGQDRTLSFNTTQTATDDDRRKEFARVFKLGLIGYAADTTAGAALDVTYTKPKEGAAAAPQHDPWNYWVFRVNGSLDMNGEQLSNSRSYRTSAEASRTTENWKLRFNGNQNVNRDKFQVDDETTIHSRRDSWSINGLVVKSLGPKWSAGVRSFLSHSSFSNTDRSFNFAPGIEYDFFPYSESSRRILTLLYSVGPTHFDYNEVTIYDKTSETIPKHSLDASLSLRQPWGSLGIFSSFSQQLNDPKFYRMVIFGSADVRLFKGFSFNVFGEYDKIKDLIGLPKGAASTEEVLLRLRQLQTNYSYFLSVGVSYSFGSIFNTIVNPRFER